jgi:serine O-acetyltransferase
LQLRKGEEMEMESNLVYFFYKASHSMYKRKIPFLPTLMKGIIRLCFCAVIPPELEVGQNVLFGYNGLGIVIHPNCRIGDDVIISQNVTIGGREGPEVPIIGNNVMIGAGAKILGNVKIGNNAKIGANAVVLIDVPENATAVGVPAVIVAKNKNKKSFVTA